MTDPSSSQFPLPHSVEELIRKICTDQSQPPLGVGARRVLASLGDEEAINILRKISMQKIHTTFDGFIHFLAKKLNNNNSNDKSPTRLCVSPSSASATTSTAVRLFNSPDNKYKNSGGSPQKRLCFSPIRSNLSPTSTTVRFMNSPESSNSRIRGLPMSSEKVSGERFSSQLMALGELEFRKQFLILNYLGEKRMEEAISSERIRDLKDFPMHVFEMAVWDELGKYNIGKEDRRKILDWDSGNLHVYQCHISLDGSCRFKGPYLSKGRTFLHAVLGDENVLMVKFAEDRTERGTTSRYYYTRYYNKIAREGILVGLRRYRFFVFKDGGKGEKGKDPNSSGVRCYFARLESDAPIDRRQNYILFGKTVHEARCIFMHVHTVSSLSAYMARFSLILSKTMELKVDLQSINIARIDDVPCQDEGGNNVYDKDGKLLIHTDGTGFISEDLALKCPKNAYKGNCYNNAKVERFFECDDRRNSKRKRSESQLEEPPLLIQFRLFNNGCAVKGTFLLNKKLPEGTIQVRPSMIKVETDPKLENAPTKNSLEVVGTSNHPKKACLSRNLIALLSYGGIPKKFFLDILMNALEEAHSIFSNKRAALKVSLNRGEMDDFSAARMILAGIPFDESYLQTHLSRLIKIENNGLKGGKLPVPECYYLMGTTDPTGILEIDEVCIILDNGPISGKVLVYRNPGLHFGDIHVLKATFVAALGDFVGNAKYAIFFPCKGPRSLADEIAGGDFDGDMYFVSRNPELLKHFKESDRWISASLKPNLPNKKPSEFSSEELEDELFKLFLSTRFEPSYSMSVAADSWLVLMDRLLTLGDDSADEKALVKQNLYQLIDIYYDALDAPKKSGRMIEIPEQLKAKIFPHYMERGNMFKSKSILGVIYDTVTSYEVENLSSKEIRKLPLLNEEVSEECLRKWKDLYEEYRGRMHAALQSDGEDKDEDGANQVIKDYKKKLYDAAEFEQSARNAKEIYEEALAIYHVVYDYAMAKGDTSKCGFAWKVAGAALCKLYAYKQNERCMVCLPSVLVDIYG
ncbi:RdRP domain-containing protein [Cephalotus follicularis]|uniref:RNA-dependent RNA polymerase n=1 Tax=Cephalotus follicularis TaxID=3775 RepID=A0A1Q3D6H6_CEPFO|nr:RdRP domain-containing protein [Cephalotus follicularis]